MSATEGHADTLAPAQHLAAERQLIGNLHRLVGACAAVLRVKGVALALLDRRGRRRTLSATDAPGDALERAQRVLDVGPGVDAVRRADLVAVDDLARDGRYPLLAGELSGRGISSVLCVPVVVEGMTVGSLGAYRDHPGPWSEQERRAARAYADLVSLVLRVRLRPAAIVTETPRKGDA